VKYSDGKYIVPSTRVQWHVLYTVPYSIHRDRDELRVCKLSEDESQISSLGMSYVSSIQQLENEERLQRLRLVHNDIGINEPD
jgi:hypothetical protein